MKIKSFIAPNIEMALDQVRKEIGQSALVLETRECEGRGFKGFLGKNLVEVIAAFPEDVAKDTSLDDAKDLFMDKLKVQLRNKGLRKEIVKRVLEPGANGEMKENEKLDINNAKLEIRRRIAGMINTKNVIEEKHNPNGKKTIAFVGPTGVGKTTTLAKVAAKLAIDNNKSVGIVTIDTYRIAAVDQLMAYTDMMDIPVRIVHTPKELSIAANEFMDKDYVLIDTTGRSQYDKKRIMMLRGLLKILPSMENYLVMSAGTRNREANDIFANFNILPLHGFIFSKIDEAKSFGMLLNLIVGAKIPVCCLTNGQEVPDDILNARPEGIADLILN